MDYEPSVDSTLPKCVVCQAQGLKRVFNLQIGVVLQCSECTLAMLWKADLSGLADCEYDASYYAAGEKSDTRGYADYAGSELEPRRAFGQEVVGIIKQYAQSGTLLDVGCGGGLVVHAAQRSGFHSHGIDSSRAAIDLAERFTSRDSVSAETLQQHAKRVGLGTYDVVTLFDVIEHVDDPTSFLRLCLSLLRPGGYLFMSTPRYGGSLSRATGSSYPQFKLDHVTYFTETAMARVLEQADIDPWNLTLIQFELARAGCKNSAVMEKYVVQRDTLFVVAGPVTGDVLSNVEALEL